MSRTLDNQPFFKYQPIFTREKKIKLKTQNTTLSELFQNTIENIIGGSNWIPLTHNYITDHFPVLAQESDRFQ